MHFLQYNPTYPPHLLGFFLAFLLYFVPSEGYSQLSEADSIQIWSDMDLANSFYKSRQWDSADYYFGEVIKLGKKTEEWEKVMFAYFRKGERWWRDHTQYQRAIDTLNKGLSLGYEKLGDDYWFYSYYYLIIAKCENSKNNYTEALNYCKKAEYLKKKYHIIPDKVLVKIRSTDKVEKGLGGCYSVFAQIYQTRGIPDSAIQYYLLAIQEMDKFPKSQKIPSLGVQNQLAWAYIDYGDLQSAMKLCKKNLTLINRDPDISEIYQTSFRSHFYRLLGRINYDLKDYENALFYINLAPSNYYSLIQKGLIYHSIEEYDKAIGSFDASIKIMEKAPEYYFNHLNSAYQSLAEIYTQIENFEEAEKYTKETELLILNKSNKGLRNNSVKYNYLLSELHLTKGKIYLNQEKNDLAESYLKKVTEADFKEIQSSRIITRSSAFNILGEMKLKEKEYEGALKLYDNSIRGLAPDYAEKIRGLDISLPLNLDLLFASVIGKAQTHYQWYKNKNEITHLKESAILYEEALNLISRAKYQYTQEAAKISFKSNGAAVMGDITQCFIDLFEETQDSSYLDKIFTIIDKNKAGVLAETVQSLKTQTFLGIPDSILSKENSLKVKLAHYEQKIFDRSFLVTIENTLSDSLISKWAEITTNIKNELEELTEDIHQKFPDYAKINYQSVNTSIADVQKKILTPGEIVLEYVIGKSNIYVFKIEHNRFQIVPISKPDSLAHQIDMLREGIYGYWTASSQTYQKKKKNDKAYTIYARKLYQTLISSVFPDGKLPQKIIIIPDGILNYVPFEALLSEAPKAVGQFNQYSYLINQTQISYGLSAALLIEMTQKRMKAKNNLLAIAPTFKESDNLENLSYSRRDNFSPLLYTKGEVNYLGDMFSSEVWTEAKASKQSFIEQAKNYRIIHLATHAKMLDDQPKFSRIAFTQLNDTIDQPDFLTIAEIYNLKLNAEMVVLSACETGIGKLKKGEGVMSMARAFAFSGSKSIITSLWSVDDQATSKIMKSFYSYLDQGETKDAALQKAKLDYINNHDSQASHPFFWAGFVGFGDMSPTSLQADYNWLWILLLGILTLITIIYFYRKNHHE